MKTSLALSSRLLVCVCAALADAACGGSPPPAPAAPAPSAAAAPTDSSTPGASSGSASAAPASSSSASPDSSSDSAPVSVDSQREPFMQGCMKRVQAPDYCQCGFEQFQQLFKGTDMAKLTDDDPRFAQLQQQTMTQCASKLPEDTIKASFITGCTGSEPKKAAYCACAWPALRKSLSVVDFISDFKGPRFDDAKKTMVKSCKGKFPAAVAKAEFMGECTKNDPSTASRCGCVWKKLAAKYTTEQIAAGMADLGSTPGVDTCK